MKILFNFFVWLTCFVSGTAGAQAPNYLALNHVEQIPWERYELLKGRFVVSGEAHSVSCVYPFQYSQLKYLVSKGVRNLVWEVPYSFAYIALQYISTGNDSLLRFLSGTKEDSAYWKDVYLLNQTLPKGGQLHIWGIDHELGDNVGGAYRKKIFVKAIELLMAGKKNMPPALSKVLLSLKTDTTIQAVTEIKYRLQQMLNDPSVSSFLGDQLPHFTVLVNRLDHYKVSRNDEMLEAFKEIYSLFHFDSAAKFLGRFGWAHTDKSYKKSMAWLLQNDPTSPVKNSTLVIGVQYLNCGLTGLRTDLIENDGIVNDRKQRKALAALNQQDPSPVKIFTWPPEEEPHGWAKSADVLFVFSGFPGVSRLTH